MTADFSVVDPHRMRCVQTLLPKRFTRPLLHAWRAWVNVNATRCENPAWPLLLPYKPGAPRGRGARTDTDLAIGALHIPVPLPDEKLAAGFGVWHACGPLNRCRRGARSWGASQRRWRTFETPPDGGGRRMARRRRVEPTDEWAELELLLEWPEQVEYERIRPPVVFGSPVAERSRQTGTPETTLRRRVASFENEGMRGLFEPERVEVTSTLPPEVRRLILDLKAEHPPMRDNEIATVCYVRFGRRPHGRTVRRVLEANPTAMRMFRRFKPYHEIPDAVERRLAVVTLHAEGWNTKSIAGYLKTSRPTVYRTLKKWIAEGVHGLEDKPRGGKRKVNLKAMNEARKLQENPGLGEFRVSAALELLGIYLSPRTCGRILAVNRKLYGLEKPKRGSKEKKEMPFQSSRRHEIWSVDVRYLDHNLPPEELPEGGKVYSISILENHSRALLASAVSTSQDLTAYLSVLYTAVERYGSPEVLVSDGGAIFRANQAKAVYRAL